MIIDVLQELRHESKTPHRIYRDGHFYRPATLYRYVHFLWKAGLIEVETVTQRSGVASSVRRFKLTSDGETLLEAGMSALKRLRFGQSPLEVRLR